MSFVLLGILNSQASAVAQAYFLSVLGGVGDDSVDNAGTVATDSADSLYVVGRTDSAGAGSRDLLFSKYNSLGEIQFQRVLGGAGDDRGTGIAVDSSDNFYICGFQDSTGAGGNDFILAKYDTSGSIQWQRSLGGAETDSGRAVVTDSANNVYILGDTLSTGAGASDFLLAKYNSSGTIQWQRVFGGSESDNADGIAVDSSDNVYVVGSTKSTGEGGFDFLLAKYDSSGTIQWQRVFGGSENDFCEGIAVDSSDNVYIFGRADSPSATRDFLLAKYNSSGTIQWQRSLGGADSALGYGVATDSTGNVYLLGDTSAEGAGNQDFLFAKYDSSGTIQFQRLLGGASLDVGKGIAVDSSDNVCLLGNTQTTGAGNNDFLIGKLPNDGSLEGTYSLDGNNIIYQASTLSTGTPTLTSSTSSLTAATASLTSSTSSLTDAASSLTSVTLDITP